MKNLYFASDHAGFKLKNLLMEKLKEIRELTDLKIIDLGTHNETSCDYPVFAKKVADVIEDNKDACGILICGTGIGMSIAANRFSHVRAALCFNQEMAEYSRRHNDANILIFGAKVVDDDLALKCIEIFLSTSFDGGRHERRLNLIRDFCTVKDE